MRVGREEAIIRRVKLLEELFLLIRTGEKFSQVDLARKYGLGTTVFRMAMQYGVIKKEGNSSYLWVTDEPDRKLAENLFLLEVSSRPDGVKQTRTVAVDVCELECKDLIGLDRVIMVTEIGIRYGVKRDVLGSFVKDILKLRFLDKEEKE